MADHQIIRATDIGTLDAALGISDMTTVELVPRPREVYQLEGHKPDVATLAYNMADARDRIAKILGVEQLSEQSKVVRIS